MYDWNHNGKHDAFDDAMFMALYEDDLERHPPKNKKRNRSSDSSGDGCFWLILLIFLGIIVGGLFLLGILMTIVDGDVWLLLVLIAMLAGVVYVYQKNNTNKQTSQFTNDAATSQGNGNNMPEMNTTAESEYHYKMTVTGIEITGCVCTDKSELKIPAMIQYTPVCAIGAETFKDCKNLRKILLPDTITKIADGAFSGLNELTIYAPFESYARKYAIQHKIACEGAYKFDTLDATQNTVKTESKKTELKKSVSTSGSTKTTSSTKTSSNAYSKNNASTVSSYAAGLAASTILIDDSADWEDHGTARDRLDDDLIGTGYDSYDLEWMDEDERDEILWDNGLDPLDYDFYGLDDMD